MRSRPAAPPGREGGFALAMVVLLLFTIAVAGATGYQLVSAEHELATGVEAQEEALAVARGGLERYVGEHIGVPGAPTTFATGDGSVTVTQQKILTLDDVTDVYLLQAVGTVTDRRYPSAPARRTIRQYAKLHTVPVRRKAALMAPNDNVTVALGSSAHPTRVLGTDGSTAGQCVDAGGPGVMAIAGSYGATVASGTDVTVTGGVADVGDVQALIDTVDVRWSALQDPDFTIPFNDGIWPDFSSIPSDSFPVIRVNGDFTATSSRSGRGALIVTGRFAMDPGFSWDGIILAGSSTDLEASSAQGSEVDGMVVAGLDGGSPGTLTVRYVDLQYDECAVRDANRSLAYFELVDGARWEF